MKYVLYVAGTDAAQQRWKSGRSYSTRSSALRRLRQIRQACDFDVGAIYILKEGESGSFISLKKAKEYANGEARPDLIFVE